jgi:hypothetical protein
MSDLSPNPSLRELLNGISTDARLLTSQTLALARLEVSTAASKLVWSGVGVLASVFVVVAGASVLVSALVLILIAIGLPAWSASTVVGIALTAGGALSARFFVTAIRHTELGLKETQESLRETLEWLKLQTRN